MGTGVRPQLHPGEGAARLRVTHKLLAAVEELGVRDGVHEVGADDVGPETFGGLVGHLHPVLQDGHGEVGGRVAGQPHAEVGVSGLGAQLLWEQESDAEAQIRSRRALRITWLGGWERWGWERGKHQQNSPVNDTGPALAQGADPVKHGAGRRTEGRIHHNRLR